MNKAFNFKPGRTSNTATLTDVMSRAFVGTRQYPDAPAPPLPPMRELTLDYPHISTQPQYAAEVDKLNRFAMEREEASKKLEGLRVQLSLSREANERTEENVISKAEALLAGEVEQNLQGEIEATAKLIDVLGGAITAQHAVVRRVTEDLSRAAGRRYSQEHKQLVTRLMAAVVDLHAANQAEINLHVDLARLGYTGSALPAMRLNTVEDPGDTNGNIAHYWYSAAKEYAKTEAEIAAGVRKSRLAEALK